MEHTTSSEAVEVDALDYDDLLDDRDRFDHWTDDEPVEVVR